MWGSIRKTCWRRKVNRNLRRNALKRDASCLNRASLLGGYYAYSGEEEWKRLLLCLQAFKKDCRPFHLLAYDPDHRIGTTDNPAVSVLVMDDKDMDFCKMPKIGKGFRCTAFFEREYDLFIDFSSSFHFVDASVVSLAKAKMKVGKDGIWGVRVNDLIFTPQTKGSYVEAFVRTVETYLPFLGGNIQESAGRERKGDTVLRRETNMF